MGILPDKKEKAQSQEPEGEVENRNQVEQRIHKTIISYFRLMLSSFFGATILSRKRIKHAFAPARMREQ
jgi:hypothetical protein